MSVRVDLELAVDEPGIPAMEQFQQWVEAALSGRRDLAEVAIRIVDSAESRHLNRQYRQQDKPTNVLSFPFESMPGVDLPMLGDLAICAPVVSAEARHQEKPLQAHWAHMVVHGTLHLLGYDHQSDTEAGEMEGLETDILNDLGFENPYKDD